MKKPLPIFWATLFVVVLIILIRFSLIAGSIGISLNWKWIFWGIIIASAIGGLFWWSSKKGSASTSTFSFPLWAKRILSLAIIIIAIFFLYREWDSAEKLGRNLGGFAEKAFIQNVSLKTLRTTTVDFPGLPPARYKVEIFPSQSRYWFVCENGMDGQGVAVDTPKERKMACPRQRTEQKCFDAEHGNIRLSSPGSGSPVGHNDGLFVTKTGGPITFQFALQYPEGRLPEKSTCEIMNGGLKVQIILTPL